MKISSLKNKRFGRLTALKIISKKVGGGDIWLCSCDCGGYAKTVSFSLRNGKTKSCGCLRKERALEANTVHGKLNTPGYNSWIHMKKRCYNKSNKSYKWYGGRGIKVCKRWLNSFSNFIKDMGNPPIKGMCVDRINNDGDYTPSNCQWLTRSQNNSKMNRERKEKRLALARLEGDKVKGGNENERT